MKKILTAMSGGVDSSVAAALLREQGFELLGVTMNLFGAPAESSSTPNTAVSDARTVADFLSIPHHVVDAVDVFERTVVSYFVDEYRQGRTPNPCVVCNRHLKFGMLMDAAMELGCDGLATGHYAIIDNQRRATTGRPYGDDCAIINTHRLKRGVDVHKDQSYFLYPILTSRIDKILFPLGELTKDEVRALAKKFGLPAADKGDSQDICFIPSGNYLDLLKSRGIDDDKTPGHITDINGKIIGTHTGIHNFTVGQRKGLGALGRRMYVKRIDIDNNAIIAAEEHELGSDEIIIRDVIRSDAGIDVNKRYQVQIRYRSAPVSARVVDFGTDVDADNGKNIRRGDRPRSPAVFNVDADTNINADRLRIIFDTPVRAASPGQSAVIYDGDTVVAGGVIRGIQAGGLIK